MQGWPKDWRKIGVAVTIIVAVLASSHLIGQIQEPLSLYGVNLGRVLPYIPLAVIAVLIPVYWHLWKTGYFESQRAVLSGRVQPITASSQQTHEFRIVLQNEGSTFGRDVGMLYDLHFRNGVDDANITAGGAIRPIHGSGKGDRTFQQFAAIGDQKPVIPPHRPLVVSRLSVEADGEYKLKLWIEIIETHGRTWQSFEIWGSDSHAEVETRPPKYFPVGEDPEKV